MREHMHHASMRRDEGLARIRKISLWITGGAAFASLGLGTAFAHALPGHASAATSTGGATVSGSPRTGAGAAQSGGPAQSGARTSGKTGSRHHQHALAKPAQAPQQPASNPAPPPVVSSGGS
jgi:hypothetical protein